MKNVMLTGLVLSTLIFGFYVRSHEGEAVKPGSNSSHFSQAIFHRTALNANGGGMKTEIQKLRLIRLGSPMIKSGLMLSQAQNP